MRTRIVAICMSVLVVAGCSAGSPDPTPHTSTVPPTATDTAPAPDATVPADDRVASTIKGMGHYVAAQDSFPSTIDLTTSGLHMPYSVGHSSMLVVSATVEASLDFGSLPASAFAQSSDGLTVYVNLPAVKLAPPKLDLEHSYLSDAGLKVHTKSGAAAFGNDKAVEQEALQLVQADVAVRADGGGTRAKAEKNIRAILESLLGELGFTKIVITFAVDAPHPTSATPGTPAAPPAPGKPGPGHPSPPAPGLPN